MIFRKTKGSVAIEFALVMLFILIPLLFGTIDFALLLHNQQVVTNASREGARAGIARSSTGVPAVVESYCANRLIPANNTLSTQVSGGGAFQNDLKVTVTYRHDFMFASLMGFEQITITSKTVMKMEPVDPL